MFVIEYEFICILSVETEKKNLETNDSTFYFATVRRRRRTRRRKRKRKRKRMRERERKRELFLCYFALDLKKFSF